jgi:pimeloyl-ACP methyl ester carboxylesterase
MKDVIVLLPGIMGSALEKNGSTVWDASTAAVGQMLWTMGGSLINIALSGDTSTGEGVTATHLVQDVHLIPFFWKIDGYSELSHFIQTKLEVTPGEDFFEFPYDWRLDNRVSARRLAKAAAGWLDQRRRQYSDARLVLIGHSMGGLVARYFIEVLAGWRDTKMLITLGTPYRGSVKALDFLSNGLRKRLGPVTLLDLSQVVKSFPSVYQLLPIYPCVGDTADSLQSLETIDRATIGELDVRRARDGVRFHREIEHAVETNRKDPAYGCRLLPVVGTYQPTFLSAVLTTEGVEPLMTYKGESMLDGDGTVPHFSAIPIELSTAKVETFVACPHASLQNFDPVRVQMRAALQDVDISELKAARATAISLDLRDAIIAGEVFVAHARCPGSIDPLSATLCHLETSEVTEAEFVKQADSDGWQSMRISGLVPGTYRIRVEAGSDSEPIDDVFVVLHGNARATSIQGGV